MSDEQKIVEALQNQGLTLEGHIVSSTSHIPTYFVTILVNRDSDGRQIPNNRILHSIKENLTNERISVEFLLRYADSEQIESGLRATLLHSHIDHIRNVFVSFESRNADVWIEPKHVLEESDINSLRSRAQTFLELFELKLTNLSVTSDEVLPTKYAILTTIRILAPASLSALSVELGRRGFKIPSPDWLVRRLDVLRKSGNIVRLAGGQFALTRLSLHTLGTAKNRRSPDVGRLLALARRDG